MDTAKLQILLHVVDCGSVQGASRHLGVSRSSLRRALDGLEAEVGTTLLHRDGSGVRLTPAGAVLVARGRMLVTFSDAALADTRAAGEEGGGTIRVLEPVGLPVSMRAHGLLATRGALAKLRLVIRQVEDPLAHAQEPVEMMLHEGSSPDREDWFTRVILRAPLRLLASPAYVRDRGAPRTMDELAAHDTIAWRRPRRRADEVEDLGGRTFPISPWLASPDLLLLRAVAAAGGGILLAPHTPFLDEPGAPPLLPVLEDQVGGELVYRVSSPLPSRADPRVRDTVAQMLQILESLPIE